MSKIIEAYYAKANVMPLLLKQKLRKLEKHSDIANEFEFWIKEQHYKKENCIAVEGYTAEGLSSLSNFLDGEGSFMLLIELRENPEMALRKISDGFKMR